MKQWIFALCLCTATLVSAQGEEAQVRKQMALQEASWNAGDIPGFMEHYWKHDSLRFIGGKGITYGWRKTLENYLQAYPDQAAMGTLRFTIETCRQLSPSSIYVIGRWSLQKEKPAGGYFTLLWEKIDGKWRIVADHTS